jgi:hypothetical protein
MSSDIPEESFVFYIWNRDYLLEYDKANLFRFFPNSNAIAGGLNRTFDISGYNFSVSEIIKKDYVGNTAETVSDNEIPTDAPPPNMPKETSIAVVFRKRANNIQEPSFYIQRQLCPWFLNEDLFKFSPDGTVIADGLNKTFNITETEYALSFKKIKPSTPAPSNAPEGLLKKTIKKIDEWRWYLVFADLLLGQTDLVEILKAPRSKNDRLFDRAPDYKDDLRYRKRVIMDRMDRDNNKDDTGADYRGYRSGMQIVARFARKVSAFIEDNMFLMGMGVDGCGNMHRFLEPNRNGIFDDANFNEDAIIWRIINNQNLNLDGLNLLDNLIALNAALNREFVAADGHLWIQGRLSARIDEIEKKIIELGRAAAARRGMPLEQRLDDHVRHLGFERLRILAAIPDLHTFFNGDEMAVLRNRVNELMVDRSIHIGQRLDLHADLLLRGLKNITSPPDMEILEAEEVTEEDVAARLAAARREELLTGRKNIGMLPTFLIGLSIFLLKKVLK